MAATDIVSLVPPPTQQSKAEIVFRPNSRQSIAELRRDTEKDVSNMSKQISTAAVTSGFGVAAAAMFAAPEIQADVVALTFSPNSAPWTSASNLMSISIQSTGGAAVGGFSQWNDSIGASFSFNGSFASWAIAAAGEVINTSNFTGTSSGFYFTTGATGTIYLAFRATAENGGGVGWFGAQLNGSQGDIIYNAGNGGQYGNMGESLVVGESNDPGPAVPGLGGLAALAVGATGLRGRRQRVAG